MCNENLVDIEMCWSGNNVKLIRHVYKDTISMDNESNKLSFIQKDNKYEKGVSYVFDLTNVGFAVYG